METLHNYMVLSSLLKKRNFLLMFMGKTDLCEFQSCINNFKNESLERKE